MTDMSGVGPVSDDAHTVKAVYSGSDIALGITFQTLLGEQRTLTIQTHTMRDAPVQELNDLLDKITSAGDRAGLRYRLRELELVKAQREKEVALRLENFRLSEERWAVEWKKANKRGPFQLTGQQITMREQANKAREDLLALITEIDVDIAKVKSQLAGK